MLEPLLRLGSWKRRGFREYGELIFGTTDGYTNLALLHMDLRCVEAK